MKMDLIVTDLPYNVLCELRRQPSDYDSFIDDDIAEVVKVFVAYVKHIHPPIATEMPVWTQDSAATLKLWRDCLDHCSILRWSVR